MFQLKIPSLRIAVMVGQWGVPGLFDWIWKKIFIEEKGLDMLDLLVFGLAVVPLLRDF